MSAASEAPAPAWMRPEWPQVALFSFSHLLGDGYVSFHVVLMPLLARSIGFSKAAAGFTVLLFSLLGILVQPTVGHLCEKSGRRAFLVLGILVTMTGSCLLGLAWSYWSVVAILLVAGVGLSSYHPAGASLAGDVSGARRGLILSIYTCAGNLGVVIGPVAIGFVVANFGLRATIWALPVGLVLLAPVALCVKRPSFAHARARSMGRGPSRKGAFAWMLVHMTLRNVAIVGMVTYLPFYCENMLKMKADRCGLVVALFTLAGALGALVGGHISDHIRRKPILIWSGALAVAPLAGFLQAPGWAAMALLAVGSALLWSGHAINVVMGQEYLPRNQSMASGMTLGMTWGVASLTLPFWGWLCDVRNERVALAILVLSMPLLTSVAAMFLTHTEKTPEQEANA